MNTAKEAKLQTNGRKRKFQLRQLEICQRKLYEMLSIAKKIEECTQPPTRCLTYTTSHTNAQSVCIRNKYSNTRVKLMPCPFAAIPSAFLEQNDKRVFISFVSFLLQIYAPQCARWCLVSSAWWLPCFGVRSAHVVIMLM